jgi:hypothetical protein
LVTLLAKDFRMIYGIAQCQVRTIEKKRKKRGGQALNPKIATLHLPPSTLHPSTSTLDPEP